jgi:PhzF family phenazine biosynthesis protein
MTGIRCLQIDAFTDRPFSGNPAAVCLLEARGDVNWLQSIAAEMNLSETAFVRRIDDGYELRWFTPAIEVELCGHATLASAHALWNEGMERKDVPIRFHTRSGVLTCRKRGDFIELDFPATPASESTPPPGLLDAMRISPSYVGRSTFDKFLVVESEEVVRSLKPDFASLRRITGMRGVIVTSPSSDPRFDFLSRYFAPGAGIDEDPVTGSAHCCLGPFWGERLGKTELVGYQASSRGGIVRVRLCGERVMLIGEAVTVFRGELVAQTPWQETTGKSAG